MNESEQLQPVSVKVLVIHQTWQSSEYVKKKFAAIIVIKLKISYK